MSGAGACALAPRARRIAAGALLALCLASYVLILRDFLHFGDRAPYVAVDDALANVSLAIGHLGRFGFPASPVQGMTFTARNEVMVNYGPWPFLAGAAMDWLFGSSYLVQRALHPLGVSLLAAVALYFFRASSLAAGGLFAWMLAEMYRRAQWPMVRPDIAVAVFGGLLIASLGWALYSGRRLSWFLAGFCAAGAAGTHQVAWSMVPASAAACWIGIPLAGAHGTRAEVARAVLRASIALACGGLLGGLVYLTAIGFRVEQLLALWRAYVVFMDTSQEQTYWSVLLRHGPAIWGAVPMAGRLLGGTALVSAIGLLAAAPRLAPALRGALVALLLPPLLVGVGYTASLGSYRNYHAGYALLAQVGLLWGVAAALAGWVQVLASHWPRRAPGLEAGLRVLSSLALLGFCRTALATPSLWAQLAARNVPISEFQREVMSDIPDGAPVWGNVSLGLESGIRTNLVQFADALALAQDFTPQTRAELLPEYLILSGTTLSGVTSQAVSGQHAASVLSVLVQLEGDARYELWSLVSAAPYGTARVYRRASAVPAPALPRVALYAEGTRSWSRRIGDPLPVSAAAVEPVDFELSNGTPLHARADRSLLAQLPAGAYLLVLSIESPAPGSGMLLASAGNPTRAEAGDLPFAMAQAPYFDHERRVSLLVEHPGGALYLSQFDANPRARFQLREVRPLLDAAQPHTAIPVPQPGSWRLLAADGHMRELPGGGLEVSGDTTRHGYQMQSPPVAVPPGARVLIRVPLEVLQGSLGLGALSGDALRWLVPPQPGRSELELDTGGESSVQLVIANVDADGALPARFRLGPPEAYTRRYAGVYADALARCRRVNVDTPRRECAR